MSAENWKRFVAPIAVKPPYAPELYEPIECERVRVNSDGEVYVDITDIALVELKVFMPREKAPWMIVLSVHKTNLHQMTWLWASDGTFYGYAAFVPDQATEAWRDIKARYAPPPGKCTQDPEWCDGQNCRDDRDRVRKTRVKSGERAHTVYDAIADAENRDTVIEAIRLGVLFGAKPTPEG